MDNPKNQIVNRLKEANNVLVTVSTNPSVDQLSAAIGLTLFLTKLNKHATAVFSGQVPSTLEFLKPEETIETTTDSLRDFIIALDKAKADKLRYKVEDKMVKIFITPYRTSISQQDLEFSQGDFNVDVVVALGVHNKEELDQAIVSHGRILHDATVATINTQAGSELGGMNWADAQASSLCEMVVALADVLKANSYDAQIATALLTGIVAETERFSNAKTSSNTMSASAKLMAAGANQQLVATKLEEPAPAAAPIAQAPAGQQGAEAEAPANDDGSLRINHEEPEKPVEQIKINEQGELQPVAPPPPPPQTQGPPMELPAPLPQPAEPEVKTEHRTFLGAPGEPATDASLLGEPSETHTGMPEAQGDPSHLIMEPPSFGGKLSATADSVDADSPALNAPPTPPILSHNADDADNDHHNEPPQLPPVAPPPPTPPPPPPKADSSASPAVTAPEPPVLPTPQPSSQPPLPAPPAPQPKPPEEAPPAPPPPPPQVEQHGLPQAVINVMDDKTLESIEEQTDSPHYTSKLARKLAQQAEDKKTLEAIEESVASPHLEYEAHESEPPAKPSRSKGAKKEESDKPKTAEPEVEEVPTLTIPGLGTTPSATTDEPTQNDVSATTEEKPTAEAPKPEEPAGAGMPNEDQARDAVQAAINAGGDGRDSLPPVENLGASNVDVDLSHDEAQSTEEQHPTKNISIDENGIVSYPKNLVPDDDGLPADNTSTQAGDASAPPPVPPPMMPPIMPPEENGQAPAA